MTGKIDPKSWEGHTPGPWHWGYDGSDASQPVVVIAVSSGEKVCRIEPWWNDRQDRADAALIAAAPDLAARVAELEAALQTSDFDLVAATVLLQQRTAERDDALAALRLALPILERDHRSLIECGSQLRATDEGTVEPIPGTLDEDCVEDARAYEAAIDAARAALKGDPA